MPAWIIRDALPNELNFIYATWLNSYKHDSALGKSCTNTTFFAEYPSIIDKILSQPKTKISIACFPDTPNIILSYLIYEAPNLLHYLFTKEIYRKNGIAHHLFEDAFSFPDPSVIATHRTQQGESFLQRLKVTYNPFKLFHRIPEFTPKEKLKETLTHE